MYRGISVDRDFKVKSCSEIDKLGCISYFQTRSKGDYGRQESDLGTVSCGKAAGEEYGRALLYGKK